jgi:DNA primase
MTKSEFDAIKDYILTNVKLIDLLENYGFEITQEAPGRYKTFCPFHEEKTASFKIYDESNSYYCFGGCGEGGDVIEFMIKYEKKTFMEIMEMFRGQVDSSSMLALSNLKENIERDNKKKELDFSRKYIKVARRKISIFLRDYLKEHKDKKEKVYEKFKEIDAFFLKQNRKDEEINQFIDKIMVEVKGQ